MEYIDADKARRKLDAYGPSAHWFCPKIDDNDSTNYDDANADDEGVPSATKITRIEEGHDRLELAYKMMLSYGLGEVERMAIEQEFIRFVDRSGELLSSCDKCACNYHMGRKAFCNEIRA